MNPSDPNPRGCSYILLNKMTASLIYFTFVAIWSSAIDSAEERVRYVANINMQVGIITLRMCVFSQEQTDRHEHLKQVTCMRTNPYTVAQIFGTGWLISRLGPTFALVLVPVTCTIGMGVLRFYPTLLAVTLLRVTRNSLNFAIARPGKELLFTGTCWDIHKCLLYCQ